MGGTGCWGISLALMGGAVLKVFNPDCVTSLEFVLRPSYGRVMEVMVTSFKRTYASTV